MTDREKVIRGLECCVKHDDDFKISSCSCSSLHCPYLDDCAFKNNFVKTSLIHDALELLKEQEAVKPKLVGVNTWTCGECGGLLGWEEFSQSGLELAKYKYCPHCGRKVKWDD